HGAVEVTRTGGAQILGQLVVGDPAFHQSKYPAGMADNVGVGAQQFQARSDGSAAGRGLTEPARHGRGADPAIAVPVRLAVSQADAVHHAVAGEPVVGLRVDVRDGIRPVAHVSPVEVGWDGAGDGQFGDRALISHRRVVARKVVVTHRVPLPARRSLVHDQFAASGVAAGRTPASLPPAERQPTLGCAVGAARVRGVDRLITPQLRYAYFHWLAQIWVGAPMLCFQAVLASISAFYSRRSNRGALDELPVGAFN